MSLGYIDRLTVSLVPLDCLVALLSLFHCLIMACSPGCLTVARLSNFRCIYCFPPRVSPQRSNSVYCLALPPSLWEKQVGQTAGRRFEREGRTSSTTRPRRHSPLTHPLVSLLLQIQNLLHFFILPLDDPTPPTCPNRPKYPKWP